MQLLAALGDAPTAVIAVVAILLGLFLAARGPRETRAAGAADATDEPAPTPTLLKVPVTPAPEREPGFVGPEGTIVGHGTIRLGAGRPEPAAAEPAMFEPQPIAAEPAMSEPAAAEPAAAEPAVSEPAAAEPAVSEPPPADPAPDPQPVEPKDPAWRVAARAANSAVHFRQGTIRVGGKPIGKRKDD